jgi:hypothetical protein
LCSNPGDKQAGKEGDKQAGKEGGRHRLRSADARAQPMRVPVIEEANGRELPSVRRKGGGDTLLYKLNGKFEQVLVTRRHKKQKRWFYSRLEDGENLWLEFTAGTRGSVWHFGRLSGTPPALPPSKPKLKEDRKEDRKGLPEPSTSDSGSEYDQEKDEEKEEDPGWLTCAELPDVHLHRDEKRRRAEEITVEGMMEPVGGEVGFTCVFALYWRAHSHSSLLGLAGVSSRGEGRPRALPPIVRAAGHCGIQHPPQDAAGDRRKEVLLVQRHAGTAHNGATAYNRPTHPSSLRRLCALPFPFASLTFLPLRSPSFPFTHLTFVTRHSFCRKDSACGASNRPIVLAEEVVAPFGNSARRIWCSRSHCRIRAGQWTVATERRVGAHARAHARPSPPNGSCRVRLRRGATRVRCRTSQRWMRMACLLGGMVRGGRAGGSSSGRAKRTDWRRGPRVYAAATAVLPPTLTDLALTVSTVPRTSACTGRTWTGGTLCRRGTIRDTLTWRGVGSRRTPHTSASEEEGTSAAASLAAARLVMAIAMALVRVDQNRQGGGQGGSMQLSSVV